MLRVDASQSSSSTGESLNVCMSIWSCISHEEYTSALFVTESWSHASWRSLTWHSIPLIKMECGPMISIIFPVHQLWGSLIHTSPILYISCFGFADSSVNNFQSTLRGVDCCDGCSRAWSVIFWCCIVQIHNFLYWTQLTSSNLLYTSMISLHDLIPDWTCAHWKYCPCMWYYLQ